MRQGLQAEVYTF